MFRVVFIGESAIHAIKQLYGWMAENPKMAEGVTDVVVNHRVESWEAVAYGELRWLKGQAEG